MNPLRKIIPIQMLSLETVSENARVSPAKDGCTSPMRDMPRFSIKSPVFAHTTITKTMNKVLMRSRRSWVILRRLVVSGSRGRRRNGNHGFGCIAAGTRPLPTFRAQLQKRVGFVIQALAFVIVPQRFLHDAPYNLRAEIVLVVKAVDAGHHFRFGKMWILDMRQLVAAGVRECFHAQETLLGH